jgi:lipoprotein NlpD
MRRAPRQLMGCRALLALTIVLAGCAARTHAPVDDQSRGIREPTAEYREVVAGDTLYSIAWENGRDYRELAAWNHLAPPYTIRPGQKLRLRPPAGLREEAAPDDAPDVHIVKSGETLYGIARATGNEPDELAAWNNLSPPYTLSVGQTLRLTSPTRARPAPAKSQSGAKATGGREQPPRTARAEAPKPHTKGEPNKQEAAPTASRSHAPAAKRTAAVEQWSWPAEGALLERFNANGRNKGIDIGGNRGAPVHAAAAGHVVYQGSGLRGYGQLIIVKHNADYLSAYAHCDRTYVREGDVIKRGQKIAEMGSSGADRVKLHFEIRHRGNPVDPLAYLPRK